MRIGIFGGTFNPIHNGHLLVAEETKEQFDLEEVIFIPLAQPPHKEEGETLDSRYRLEMVRLAANNYPHFKVSTIEIDRGGKTYSIETLSELRKNYGEDSELFFILGIDSFLDIVNWKDFKTLLTLSHFIVVSRPSYRFQNLLHQPILQEILSKEDAGIEEKLIKLDKGELSGAKVSMEGGRFLFLCRISCCEISSTEIRSRLREKKNIKYLLPEAVESYIINNKLYI